jgi:hypothetical protein
VTVFRYQMPLSVTLMSPFATRGLIFNRASLDLPLARNDNTGDDGKGELILPGTLITGVVRAALTRLAEAASGEVDLGGETRMLKEDLDALFGHESRKDTRAAQEGWRVANEPERAQLVIRDLVIDETSKRKQIQERRDYPRIKLDEELASVIEGFLQFVEMPFAIGEEITFAGTADLKVGAIGADRTEALLRKALALVPAVGAIKSSGFGRLLKYDVGAATAVRAIGTGTSVRTGVPLPVEYRIDRPFLVGGRMASANLFKGSPVIPGATIKGALAATLATAKRMTADMAALLAEITIGHAFPRPAAGSPGDRPWQPLPLSLATSDCEKRVFLFDRLFDPLAVTTINGRLATLAFQGDTKHETLLKEHFGLGWDLPEYEVRTRTKIDPDTGSAAFENDAGQLFSYAAVKAGQHLWRGRLFIPDGVDPALAKEVVGLLETGIVGLGKTGALIQATIGSKGPVPPNPSPERPYALMLATPALLNDLDALRGGRSLFDDYACYWRGVGYELKCFFARQELVGGYLALRYPPRQGVCEPYFVTEPGSVFLVEPMDGAVSLQDLLTFGLKPNAAFAGRDWRTCPFLPTSGFGQVVLDAVDHRGLAGGIDITPKKEKVA